MFTEKEISAYVIDYNGFKAGFQKCQELNNISEVAKEASKSVKNMGICIAKVGVSNSSNEVEKLINMIENNIIEVQKIKINDLIFVIPEEKPKKEYQSWQRPYKFHR